MPRTAPDLLASTGFCSENRNGINDSKAADDRVIDVLERGRSGEGKVHNVDDFNYVEGGKIDFSILSGVCEKIH